MVTAPEVWPGVKLMTGADLIVAAPWIIFAVALAAICIFLFRSRRASRPDRGKPADGPPPKEERCPPQNDETRRP
jgi:hypothetical protein